MRCHLIQRCARLVLVCALLASGCDRVISPGGASRPSATVPAESSSTPDVAAAAQQLERGRYLAILGHCAGCHTERGGAAYAGGVPIHTPFGVTFGSNLTPDQTHGLGAWTAEDFWQAMHHGRSRDGRALAPAFPYTAFTHITRSDSDDLFAYLRSLPAVQQANRPHELRFPFGTQAALRAWQWLSFRVAEKSAGADGGAVSGAVSGANAGAKAGADLRAGPGPTATPSQARGAYLFNGLGHCAACHAPRNALGQQAQAATGADLPGPGWYAPSLHPVAGRPLQKQTLVLLLKTGQTPQHSALGPMAGVVLNSTQHWMEADLHALADYMATLPATAPPTPAAPASAQARQAGGALYKDRCADCHGPNGEGVSGAYPALAGNSTVVQPSLRNLVQVLRHGGFAPTTAANPRPYGMPPQMLTDAQTAAVLSFVRQSWGHQASAVTELDVLRLR